MPNDFKLNPDQKKTAEVTSQRILYHFKNVHISYLNTNINLHHARYLKNLEAQNKPYFNCFFYGGYFYAEQPQSILNHQQDTEIQHIEIDLRNSLLYTAIEDLKATGSFSEYHSIKNDLANIGLAKITLFDELNHSSQSINLNFNPYDLSSTQGVYAEKYISASFKHTTAIRHLNHPLPCLFELPQHVADSQLKALKNKNSNGISYYISAQQSMSYLEKAFAHLASHIDCNYLDLNTSLPQHYEIHISANALNHNAGLAAGEIAERMGLKRDFSSYESLSMMNIIQAYKNSRMSNNHDCTLYIHELSSQGALDVLKNAKHQRLNIKASVNIHHLLFNEIDIAEFNTLYKMAPPLRSNMHQKSLVDALRDGLIDFVVSGNCLSYMHAKQQSFKEAAVGAASMPYLLPALMYLQKKYFQESKQIDLKAVNSQKVVIDLVDLVDLVDLEGESKSKQNILPQNIIWIRQANLSSSSNNLQNAELTLNLKAKEILENIYTSSLKKWHKNYSSPFYNMHHIFEYDALPLPLLIL